MTIPRCSVIIPTYNCGKYIGRALNSVRVQEVADIEIIVVDDGSTDGTDRWLEEAFVRYGRLVVLQGGHKGPNAARNLAISQARGGLIAFLDADDFWWPEKMLPQLAFHERNPNVSFSFTDYLHFDVSGRTHGTCFEYWSPPFSKRRCGEFSVIQDAERAILASNTVGTSTVVATRAALQNANGFATDLQSAADWKLWLKLANKGRVAVSCAVTMNYLMRSGSISENHSVRIAAMREIVAAYDKCSDPETRRAWRQARARIRVAEAEYLRLSGNHWSAAKAHLGAFLSNPGKRIARAGMSDIANSLFVR